MNTVVGPFPSNSHSSSNSPQGDSQEDSQRNSEDTTSKISAAAQQAVNGTPKHQATDEREFYIKFIMNEKGVSRDVAAAEYDWFN
jgi:hypothetical protein